MPRVIAACGQNLAGRGAVSDQDLKQGLAQLTVLSDLNLKLKLREPKTLPYYPLVGARL